MMSFEEKIYCDEELLAIIIYGNELPDSTLFITPTERELQVGYIVRDKDEQIVRHFHKPEERVIHNTAETLIVLRGEIDIDIYSRDKSHVGQWCLKKGNVIVLFSGGHGLYFRDDSVLLEIKQGPYLGFDEKISF
jgi:hypothetical protein